MFAIRLLIFEKQEFFAQYDIFAQKEKLCKHEGIKNISQRYEKISAVNEAANKTY